MAMTRFHFLSCLGGGALALACQGGAGAGYPERPIKFVIPYAAGGATDILGRLLASGLSEKLGQPWWWKTGLARRHRAGSWAGGPAAPDGYTLLAGASTTLTLNPAIRNNLPHDPVNSFTRWAWWPHGAGAACEQTTCPVRSLKELVAQAKAAAPDKFSWSPFGTGSSVHFGGEMLKSVTGMRMMHVPFNGSSPASTALMGGQVQVAVDTVVASTPLVKAGKVRARLPPWGRSGWSCCQTLYHRGREWLPGL